MPRNKSSNSRKSLNDKKWSVTTIAAVFVIEFLLPSALSSYGVFFTDFVGNDCFSFHDALWTPVVFIASRNIISPWSRKICEHYDERNNGITKYISVAAVFVLVIAVILSSLIQTQIVQVFSYGMFGGACTGFILCQLRISTYEDFQSKPAIFEALCQIAKASSLFVIPHLILFSAYFYGIFEAQFLFGVFLLHIIPARLLIGKRKIARVANNLSRYKTVPGYLWNQESIELPTINRRINSTNLRRTTISSNKQSDSDSDSDDSSSDTSDSYTIEEVTEEPQEAPEQDNKPTALSRCKTDMGVEILPEIPEEDEVDEDYSSPKKLSVDMKRLSEISNKIQEIIGQSGNTLLDVANLDNSISSKNGQKNFFLKDVSRNSSARVACCSPYQNYLFRRRTRIMMDTLYDNFVKPLSICIKTFYFYPALYGKTCIAITSVIYITVIPHLALESGGIHKVDVTEATFLLTFIAVSWCFFLISLPWLINTSKARTKILHILGLFIKSGSMFMLYLYLSHDMITLSCLVFGFGYGIISYVEDVVYRESFGLRRWKLVRGTLDTLSGTFVIIIYLIIYLLKLNVMTLFLLFSILILVNTVLWVLAPILKFVWIYFRKRSNRDIFLT